PGDTASVQGCSARPIAASGTATEGCMPSFDCSTSTAFETPAAVGVNDTPIDALAPGSPTLLALCVTCQAPSLPSMCTSLSTSGVLLPGSSPTLVTVTLPERVVSSAAGPRKSDLGLTSITAPMARPVIARMPAAP